MDPHLVMRTKVRPKKKREHEEKKRKKKMTQTCLRRLHVSFHLCTCDVICCCDVCSSLTFYTCDVSISAFYLHKLHNVSAYICDYVFICFAGSSDIPGLFILLVCLSWIGLCRNGAKTIRTFSRSSEASFLGICLRTQCFIHIRIISLSSVLLFGLRDA